MPGRSLSPMGFRRRSVGQVPQLPSIDDIFFPKTYEAAWGSSQDGSGYKSDLEKAKIFLLRMANVIGDPLIMGELSSILMNRQYNTIAAIAAAIQVRIYGSRHATFATSPLMQCVRFILIKSRVHETIFSERTRAIIDYFFDPTLERNLDPLPAGELTCYRYPAGRLKVAIVGGGPTALSSAIALAEKGAGSVEVHMYERRWVEKTTPEGKKYVDYPPTARRRDQVVTLQDSVTSLLSKPSYQALFAGRPERVWPGSANIQIRKVEDRFLKRVQEPEFNGLIHLHCSGMTREQLSEAGDFHVLLGADGAASWVRGSYFQGYENERGRSYALGLAFNRPAGLPWSQPLNVFLTLGQTRYLLNASDHFGCGYLNMQLTEEEWHRMVAVNGEPVHFGRPGCLRKPDGSVPEGFEESQVFAPSEDRDSPLWIAISDGLKMFGFKEEEVLNVVRIPIVVQAVREGIHILPLEDSRHIKRPHALVAVAGDAAMTVHFWPGRGLNSGIKAGLALGDELVYALNHGRFIGMPLDALKQYNDFIMRLQGREHDKRSIPILNQSGSPEMLGWLLEKASSVPTQVAMDWLIGAMVQIADRLQGRDDWAFETVENVEPQLRIVLRQLDSQTLRECAVSFPWPTREMAGAEVLPIRSMKAEEKQKWVQGLWDRLKEDKKKDDKKKEKRPSFRPAPEDDRRPRSSSNARYEAPRSASPLPAAALQRRDASPTPNGTNRGASELSVPANGYTAGRRKSVDLNVPGNGLSRGRSPSPAPGEMTLARTLTMSRKPPADFLGDALSLALFRVQEAT